MRPRLVRLAAAVLLAAFVVACDGSGDPSQAPPPLAPAPTSPDDGGGACDAPEVDGASVTLFMDDGSCLPGDTIVLYRCAGANVPVLRLASEGRPVAFLGGPFAVPVDIVPANVRFVGSTGGTDVLVADPLVPSPSPSIDATSGSVSASPTIVETPVARPLVYVREDGVTARWLELERQESVEDPPIAWLIGDSILHGGRDPVVAAFEDWSLTIDAEDGRSSFAGVSIAGEAVEAGADVVLVELGTNDASVSVFRDHLVETLDLLRGVPLVLWQTAKGPVEDATIDGVNDAIRKVVADYPNTSIADWELFAPPEALMDDGIHPAEGFEDLESRLLQPLLSGWRAAVVREGPMACGPRVLRATS